MKQKITIASVPPLIKENPYQYLLFRSLSDAGIDTVPDFIFSANNIIRRRKEIDIIHFHWLSGQTHTPGKLMRFFLKLMVSKALGYRLVWTAHNIIPHKNATICDRLARALLARAADAIITHGKTAKEEIERKFVAKNKISIIPHANYLGYYRNTKSRSECRRQLNIGEDTFVYLFFGFFRKYKGLKDLVEAFEKITGDAALLIAGQDLDGTGIYLRHKADENKGIRLFQKYIPDDEVQVYFNAADVAVLPFTEITSSGSLLLALSFGKPVISVRKGMVQEIVSDRIGILVNEPGELVDALDAIRHRDARKMREAALKEAERFDWMTAADQHKRVYERILRTKLPSAFR